MFWDSIIEGCDSVMSFSCPEQIGWCYIKSSYHQLRSRVLTSTLNIWYMLNELHPITSSLSSSPRREIVSSIFPQGLSLPHLALLPLRDNSSCHEFYTFTVVTKISRREGSVKRCQIANRKEAPCNKLSSWDSFKHRRWRQTSIKEARECSDLSDLFLLYFFFIPLSLLLFVFVGSDVEVIK